MISGDVLSSDLIIWLEFLPIGGIVRIDIWTKKAQELFDELPKNYWLFAADNKLHIMRLKRNGERQLDGDSMSQKAIYNEIACPTVVDGGDW